ncbi:major facilitator superfamily domain-containing protein [Usnea florida]
MSSTASVHSSKRAQPVEIIDEYEDTEKNFQPKSLKFWSIIIGVYLSIFLVALDRTIVATAIPRITDEFNSVQDIGWYGSAYMLTAACFIPISGRIYQLYSTKWGFVLSIVIFEAGSALCGAAPTSTAFIIGRAIAGFGSAGIFSGGMMIILPLVPLRRRPVFTSMFGVAFGISSVLGPILGGTLTDHVTWRWCFYLNLPFGGFTLLAVLLFLRIESPKREKLTVIGQLKRLDPIGIFFFVPSMVSLILALQWGGSTYSWSASKVIGLIVTFSVLFIAFVVVEVLTPETAMAPTRVVLNRSIAGSMAFMFLLSGGLMSNDSAMHAGISNIPLLLSFVIIGILVAISMLLSPVLCSIGAGLLSTLSPNSSHNAWIGYQLLYGFGIGCGFQTSTLVAQNVLPRADVPLGMALMFFMQQLGGSVFLAVSQNVFSSRLVQSLSGIAGLDVGAIVNITGATALRTIVPSDQLQIVIDAYSHALTRVFILTAALSACMSLGALAVEWKKFKGKSETKGPSQSPDTEFEDSKSDVKP